MTQSGGKQPVPIVFSHEADQGWCFTGLQSTTTGLQEELSATLLGEVKVAELPLSEPVVGHIKAAGSWFIFFKKSGEQSLTGVILPDDVYQRQSHDPYRVSASVLGSRNLAALADSQADREQLARAYRRFQSMAEDTGAPLPCYCSQAIEPATSESEWAEVPLLRIDDSPDLPPAEAEQALATTAAESDNAALRQLEQRLTDLEESLRLRTRMLVATLAVAVVMPVIVGFLYWSNLQNEVEQLASSKVSTSTLMDGLLLSGDDQSELSGEDALMDKLHDLATVSVQSGAWQTGLRRREVDPGELLDTLVTIMQSRKSLRSLAKVERPLLKLASLEPVLSRLAPSTEPLRKLAGDQESLARLAGSADQLATVAEHSQPLSRIAAHEQALTGLAAVHEDLTAIAALKPGLAQLQQRQANLIALAGRRSEIETLLRTAATLDTMINEMSRVLTFMEQRQGDLEQLARRKDAVIQLTGLRDELTMLARKQATLGQLAGSSEALLELGNNIYLQRLTEDDKALSVLTSRLDALVQLTLNSNQLLQLIGAGPR